MSDFTKLVELQMGDPSGDGHNIRESIHIISNLDSKELEKAYKKGAKAIKYDPINKLCCDYEDSMISSEIIQKLSDAGYDFKDWELNEDDEDDINLDQDAFAHIILFVIKVGNPDFEFKLTRIDKFEIGGYGLFSM